MTRLAVISDLHANAHALRAALARIHSAGCDLLVINGDLLTYGVDITETLDLVEQEAQRGAIVNIGNHDQLYFDLAAGRADYYRTLPSWLRESVDYTFERLDAARFLRIRWQQEYCEAVLVAHANPFPFPDWTYLESEEELARALAVLQARNLHLGAFGHTHRARSYGVSADSSGVTRIGEHCAIVNAGSLGQPRNETATSTMLWISTEPELETVVERIDYDVSAHVRGLEQAGFGPATRERLGRFFVSKPW